MAVVQSKTNIEYISCPRQHHADKAVIPVLKSHLDLLSALVSLSLFLTSYLFIYLYIYIHEHEPKEREQNTNSL